MRYPHDTRELMLQRSLSADPTGQLPGVAAHPAVKRMHKSFYTNGIPHFASVMLANGMKNEMLVLFKLILLCLRGHGGVRIGIGRVTTPASSALPSIAPMALSHALSLVHIPEPPLLAAYKAV